MMDDVMSFWWENITGPQMLVEEISHCLSEGKNVVLQLDEPLPWQEQMRDLVMHRLESGRLELLFWEEVNDRSEIVPRLLQNSHRNELDVCPTGYDAQLTYLKNEGVFGNSVVWVVLQKEQDPLLLARFLSDYRGKGLEKHGAFLMEIPEGWHLPKLSGGTVVLHGKDFIRHGDLLLYANILADGGRKFPTELKSYIACAAANLAMRDVEMIPELLGGIDFETEDPGEGMLRLWREGYIAPAGDMPDEPEIARRLWKAQLQSAFAGIEMERLRITEEYAADIEEAIATQYWEPKWERSGYITQHGEGLENASDVELGTLVRMMNLRRNDDQNRYLLYFPDEGLRDWIIFLTECRNSLAHHRVCTPEQMCRLLHTL